MTKQPNDTTSISWMLALARANNMRAQVWNFQEGCTPTGEECKYCWAAKEVHMHGQQKSQVMKDRFGGLTRVTKDGRVVFNGKVRRIPKDLPKIESKVPTLYFATSRSDFFHEKILDSEIFARLVSVWRYQRHFFIILTKRADRMRETMDRWYKSARCPNPLPNLMLGVSVGHPKTDHRITDLTATPAAYRFVSHEPAILEVDFIPWLADLSWVVTGDGNNRNQLPLPLGAYKRLVDGCSATNTPLFIKQWRDNGKLIHMPKIDGQVYDHVPKIGGSK